MPERTDNHLALIHATESANSVAIVGLDKNAGKTTVLNALVHAWRSLPRQLVLTSIGYDGELKDLLYGHDKPQVYVFPDMAVVTRASFLQTASINPEIRAVFEGGSVFGPSVLARAGHAGFVVLSGPAALSELVSISRSIRAEWPDALFVIDGAFGRRTNASAAYADRVIFCLGGAGTTPAALAAVFRHRQALLMIPRVSDVVRCHLQGHAGLTDTGLSSLPPEVSGSNASDQSVLFFKGALTDAALLSWLANGLKPHDMVVIEDRANCFLSEAVYRQFLQQSILLQTLEGADLALVAFNPRGVQDAASYVDQLRAVAAVPVIMLDTLPAIGKAL